MSSRFPFRWLASSFLSACFLASPTYGWETWTDSSGTRTIEAEFVALEGVQLKLKREDGSELTIPLYKLDDASRSKARRIANVGGSSESLFPLALSDQPVSIPDSATLQQTINLINAEAEKGNYMIFWDTLPASAQSKVDQTVHAFVKLIDPAVLKDVGRFKQTLTSALRSKKKYLLNSTELELPPGMLGTVEKAYDPVVDFLEAILPDQSLDLQAVGSQPVRGSLKTFLEVAIPKLDLVAQQIPEAKPLLDLAISKERKIEITSETEDSAVVTVTVAGMPPQSAKWVRQEGRWVPEETVEGFKKWEESSKLISSINAQEFNKQARQGIAFASIAIGTLDAAESQEDVDDIIRGLKAQASMLGAGLNQK